MVAKTALPGHVMPTSADALTAEGFRAWVGSVHPIFVQTELAERLVMEGYDRVAVAHHVTETMLCEEFGVKPGVAVVQPAGTQVT